MALLFHEWSVTLLRHNEALILLLVFLFEASNEAHARPTAMIAILSIFVEMQDAMLATSLRQGIGARRGLFEG